MSPIQNTLAAIRKALPMTTFAICYLSILAIIVLH